MPFIQINLPVVLPKEQQRVISRSVHESLVDIFNVPEDDLFQVINVLEYDHIIYPESYLDIKHTRNMVYIYITCAFGRTVKMKQDLYAAIAKKVSEGTEVHVNDVFIMINEIPWENWSFGQGEAQMLYKLDPAK